MTNTSTTLNSPELEKYIYEILDWKFDSIADSLDNIVQTHKLSMENFEFELDQLSRRIEKIEGKIK